MARLIFFDTETTGLNSEFGDRIISLGGVEYDDREKPCKEYYQLINPQGRYISATGANVHRLRLADLKDKPIFNQIVDQFLEFIKGSTLLMHNAKFDNDMIDSELKRCDKGVLTDHVDSIVDTIELKNNWALPVANSGLDALCRYYNIDLEQRKKGGHNSLIDAKLLADVYFEMRNQQVAMDFSVPTIQNYQELDNSEKKEVFRVPVAEQEIQKHNQYLQSLITKKS